MNPASRSVPPARCFVLTPDAGERLAIIGSGLRVLMDGESSGGRCSVFECTVAPGSGPPLHRHEREDESFYVLDGRFKFAVDGREFVGETGAFACAPRGSVHAFRNIGPATGRLLVTCTPAGMEVPFRATRIPDPGSGTPALTLEQMTREFAKAGVTIVGPPLEP